MCVATPPSLQAGIYLSIHNMKPILFSLIQDEFGSPGMVVAISVDGKSLWSEGMYW